MNNAEREIISLDIESECTDNVYVWVNGDGTLCLDGNFTMDELKMIISKWTETTK